MIAVSHQELIDVSVTQGGVIEIISYSDKFGSDVSILVQPENIEILCEALIEAMKESKDNAMLAK